jgi:prepilin-type N-terminal cleavage/methylation domain-containing protein
MAIGLRSVAGLTLVEMMIVIAIVGLMVSIAVPNYLVWNQKYQLKDAVATLQANISLARMTAINNNVQVAVTVTQATPAVPVIVTFTNFATAAVVLAPMTMVPGISLANAGGALVGAGIASPQDVVLTPMGRPLPFLSTANGANNLCINAAGATVGCAGATAQALNFINANGVNYRITITASGKAAWGYSPTLAP